jgi:hypothetical protein
MIPPVGNIYDIGIGRNAVEQTYLPGGDWAARGSNNHLPGNCNAFVFLKVGADMSALGLGELPVFVPCYFTYP